MFDNEGGVRMQDREVRTWDCWSGMMGAILSMNWLEDKFLGRLNRRLEYREII